MLRLLPSSPSARAGLAALVVAAGAATAALPAGAKRPGPEVTRSPLLWATVNTCDTAGHPDTVGVRGSMPGSGTPGERMFMRIRLEYRTSPDGAWRLIGNGGDSGWIPVGAATSRVRQSGRNFTVRPPDSGAYRLRGSIGFEWRRGKKVTARATRRTAAGHTPTAGADPAGYSAAECLVKRP